MAVIFKKLTATLTSGTNAHTFTDDLINENSVIEVYTNNDEVYPVDISQNNNSVSVTFSDHNESVDIAITINNADTFSPYDDTTIVENLEGLTTVVNGLSDSIDNIEGDVSALGTMVTDLETNKQDTLTAGENITIENNVISATGGGGTTSGIGYPDFKRLITTVGNGGNAFTYTATEDCWCACYITGNGGQIGCLFIDGEQTVGNVSTAQISFLIPLGKDQVLTNRANIGTYTVKVYGIKR